MKLARLVLFSCAASLAATVFGAEESRPPEARYETREKHDRDGIGKFYMGREIAQFMSHQGASWLERSTRQAEERTDLLLAALKITPGMVVADVGAGSGYFSWRIARQVGEKGKVYAIDIQQEMLDLLMVQMRKNKVETIVVPLLGTVDDPKIPENSADLVLLVDVYHELDFPYEMTRNMIKGLKPGGKLVLVEYRGEDPNVPIKKLHKMTAEQVKKEMAIHPLKFDDVLEMLPQQHIFIFSKTAPK